MKLGKKEIIAIDNPIDDEGNWTEKFKEYWADQENFLFHDGMLFKDTKYLKLKIIQSYEEYALVHKLVSDQAVVRALNSFTKQDAVLFEKYIDTVEFGSCYTYGELCYTVRLDTPLEKGEMIREDRIKTAFKTPEEQRAFQYDKLTALAQTALEQNGLIQYFWNELPVELLKLTQSNPPSNLSKQVYDRRQKKMALFERILFGEKHNQRTLMKAGFKI